jgi:hypothetical protein
MTNPISQPVVPAQPNAAYYGIDALALFKSYTRDTYRAQFGLEAPPYDPSRLTKTWWDSTADTSHPENVAVYKIAAKDSTGIWAIRQMVIPAAEAASVNLPGAVQYPAYSVPSTNATRGGAPINPNYLSLEADARRLAAEFGADGVVEESLTMFPVVYPPEEPRRVWNIVLKGQVLNAGLLLLNRNANGIGSPGHWDTTKPEPAWAPDPPAPTGLNDTRPLREMPVRDLLANEKFQTTLTGVAVVRTDLQQSAAEASGQFTAADRAMLRAIYDAVNRLPK